MVLFTVRISVITWQHLQLQLAWRQASILLALASTRLGLDAFILSTDQWSFQPFSGQDSGDDPCKPAEAPQLLVSVVPCHLLVILRLFLFLFLTSPSPSSLSREKGVHSSLGYNPSHILTKLRAPECPKALSLSARRPRVFTVGASSGRLIPHSSSCALEAAPLLPTSIVNKVFSPCRPQRQLRLRQPRPSGSRRKAVSWKAQTRPSTIRRTLSPSSSSRSV